LKKTFLYLFYNFVKTIVRIVFAIYYSKVTYENIDILRKEKGAFILLSNHPSTLMDPLMTAKVPNRMVNFLINAGMVEHPFTNWFFNTFYCIPIKRAKDKGDRNVSNENSFERADTHLKGGGCLYIAAEGSSKLERRLRPLKTGFARIALSAESKNNFELGLKIIPTGYTYESPTLFRKKAYVKIGEPILIADFKDSWEKDNRACVRELTDFVQKRMQDLLIHTEPEDDDVDKMAHQSFFLSDNQFIPSAEKFEFYKNKVTRFLSLKRNDTATFESTKKALFQTKETMKEWRLFDRESFRKNTFGEWLTLIFGFPFYLYGLLNNILAIALPAYLAKTLKLYPGYKPAIYSVISIFTVPLFYWLQTKMFFHFTQKTLWTWIYFLTLIPMGLIAHRYCDFSKRFFARFRFSKLEKQLPEKAHQLINFQIKDSVLNSK